MFTFILANIILQFHSRSVVSLLKTDKVPITYLSMDPCPSYISLRKPKVFALQILHRYLTKEGFENFSTVYMDKRTLRSKI